MSNLSVLEQDQQEKTWREWSEIRVDKTEPKNTREKQVKDTRKVKSKA